jgi:molybdopterin converting factor small subunit
MLVHVQFYGPLRDILARDQKGHATVTLPASATVTDLLQQFKLGDTVSVAVNSHYEASFDHVLHDGDNVAVFDAVAGG